MKLIDDRERSALVMLENLPGVFRSVPHFPEANQICMNTRVDCVAPARADKSFHRLKSESSPIHFEENGTNWFIFKKFNDH